MRLLQLARLCFSLYSRTGYMSKSKGMQLDKLSKSIYIFVLNG